MNEQNSVTTKFEIERITIKSSKPFDAVVAALESAIGHPDTVEFLKTIQNSKTFAEVENTVHRSVGRSGLMLFAKFDLGAFLRKETGLDTPKIIRFDIGNPLIMKELLKHVPEAGSYAPVTILVDEQPDGVHLSYKRWRVFWPFTETPMHLLLHGTTRIRRSRIFLENLQTDCNHTPILSSDFDR